MVKSQSPDDYRAIVNFFKQAHLRFGDFNLRFFDFKPLLEGIIHAAGLPPRLKSPDPGEVQKAVEKWGEEGIKYWREYEDQLRKRTLDPPGDSEDAD